jgi:hypothetical protein
MSMPANFQRQQSKTMIIKLPQDKQSQHIVDTGKHKITAEFIQPHGSSQ